MPLYDYECPSCGKTEEKLVKVDDPSPECDKCGIKMRKQISSSHKIRRTEPYLQAKDRMR